MAQNMKVVEGLAAGTTYDATYKTHNIDDIQYKLKIVALASGATTLDPATYPSGTLFTNRGATADSTVTLPAPAAALAGYVYEFFNVAGYAIILSRSTGLTVFNNAAASTMKYGTSSEIIGAGMRAVCDGTTWLVFPMANETATVTIS